MHPVGWKKKPKSNFFQKMPKTGEFQGCETGILSFKRPELIVERLLGVFLEPFL